MIRSIVITLILILAVWLTAQAFMYQHKKTSMETLNYETIFTKRS